MKVLGIDIGGSALKGAPVDTKTGELLAPRHRIDTPARLAPAEMGAAIAAMAAHFDWKGPIGVGFPGVVQGSFIRTSANLHPDFVNLDAAAEFERATGSEVSLVNDADAAGLAEAVFGAGRDVKGAVLLLTFGTGVGSALFVDGILYPNSEFGHLKRDGESWEKFVSGAAKERRGLDYPAWAADVSAYLGQLEARGVALQLGAERPGDRRHDVGQRPVAVGRRGERARAGPGRHPRVRAESASAKARSPPTASAPSAAAETRSV